MNEELSEELQQFIINNADTMSLEELVEKTNLKEDVIVSYINSIIDRAKEENFKNSYRFTISMNPEGNLSYLAEWPSSTVDVDFVKMVGKLFYSINSGKLKPSMIDFLRKQAHETHTHKAVQQILDSWNESIGIANNVALVEPHEVFK